MSVLWLLLTVPWIGLHFVIVLCPYHTHLLFCMRAAKTLMSSAGDKASVSRISDKYNNSKTNIFYKP